ncbi:MAG TPA: hypothetical protein VNN73_22160 [Blastocatellia bacterium]|nr:hypothetical protein [Blastocatellia bacterium]
MITSRRSFLRAGSIMGLTALATGRFSASAFAQGGYKKRLGSGIGSEIPAESLKDPLANITREMFTNTLMTTYSFSSNDVKLGDLILIEVQNLNPPYVKGTGRSTKECFALKFAGSQALSLRQNTYAVQHAKLGKFQLFIVPGDASAGSGTTCTAIINRVNP